MMLDKVIEPDSLRAAPDGFTLGLRLPWYRAIPLSNVELDEVLIDGAPVALDGIDFELDGTRLPVSELPGKTDQFWWVPDTATIVAQVPGLERGRDYDVQVTLSIYPPYIRGLRRAVRWTRKMELK